MTDHQVHLRQAGAVPYCFREGRLELCLITNRRGQWGFPKGIIDPGETPEETALKESEEEAGLLGRISKEPLGEYRYRKWGLDLLVTMFLMHVTAVEDEWEEPWRRRGWFSPTAARKIIDRPELLALVDVAEQVLAEHC